MLIRNLFVLILMLGLFGCMEDNASNNQPNSPAIVDINTNSLIAIDQMSNVPVVNGNSTTGTLYIHNYSNKTINNLSFSLNKQSITNKFKNIISNSGSKNSGIEDQNGFRLINPEKCQSIKANSSCAINFSTPNLKFGNQGNSLVSVSYRNNSGQYVTTSQVINYTYVDTSQLSGVNFSGDIKIGSNAGSTYYFVGFLYAGAREQGVYKEVNLVPSSQNIRINGGFVKNQEVRSNQVISVEFAVAIQNVNQSHIDIVPKWNNQMSSQVAQVTNSTSNNTGSGLGIIITPGQNVVNYLFGTLPVLEAKSGNIADIEVVNNGNANSSGGITVEKSGGQASAVDIDDSDCQKVLESYAANSCDIKVTMNSYTSGGTTLIYKNSQNIEVGSQDIYWVGKDAVPIIKITRSNNNVNLDTDRIGDKIQFFIENIGGEAANNPATNVNVIGDSAAWVQESSTCDIRLEPEEVCVVSGRLYGNSIGSGKIYLSMNYTANTAQYSAVSLPIQYTVWEYPDLAILPMTEITLPTLIANGVDTVSQTYKVINSAENGVGILTGISLESMTKSYNPVVSGGTCNIGTILNHNESCTVDVTFGPVPSSETTSFHDGATRLVIDYKGNQDYSESGILYSEILHYALQANDSRIDTSRNVQDMSGQGTAEEPYYGTASNDNMGIVLNYVNHSESLEMLEFNLDTNNLPYGLVVAGGSCPTGVDNINLAPKQSCDLILGLDKALLMDSSQGGSVVLDFIAPDASWHVEGMGVYTQIGSHVYTNYLQPTLDFAFSDNNGSFESTVLTIGLVNQDAGHVPVDVHVDAVKSGLAMHSVEGLQNCVLLDDYSANCELGGVLGDTAQIKYHMPTYLEPNESVNIPIVYSTSNDVYLTTHYEFINYVQSAESETLVINEGGLGRK